MQAERKRAAGKSLRFLVACVLQGGAVLAALENRAQAESPALDFNRDIRPILAENCFYCHGQDANKRQADLRLDIRDVAIEAGAIVPIGAAADKRNETIPTVTTLAEQGYPNTNASNWYALLAPAKTPPALIKKRAPRSGCAWQDRQIRRSAGWRHAGGAWHVHAHRI